MAMHHVSITAGLMNFLLSMLHEPLAGFCRTNIRSSYTRPRTVWKTYYGIILIRFTFWPTVLEDWCCEDPSIDQNRFLVRLVLPDVQPKFLPIKVSEENRTASLH